MVLSNLHSRFVLAAALLYASNICETDAFAYTVPTSSLTRPDHLRIYHQQSERRTVSLDAITQDGDNDDYNVDKSLEDTNVKINWFQRARRQLKSKAKPIALAAFTATLTTSSSTLHLLRPPPAQASAPIAPIAKFKPPDQKADALKKIRDEQKAQKLKEAMEHRIKCEEIELSEGREARDAYDAEYKAAMEKRAEDKVVQRKKLQYDLLEQGICPFMDVEGIRQMYLFDNEIDLNFIPSTAQMNEAMRLRRSPKLATLREKQRFVIKCIADDVKLKGEDPLAFMEANREKTNQVLELNERKLDAIVARYTEIVASKGSLSGVIADVPFDTAAAIMGTVQAPTQDDAALAKEQAAKLKAEAKEKKKLEKAAAKAEAAKVKAEEKAAKDKLKAEEKAVKDAAKAEAKAAKEAAKAEAKALKDAAKAEAKAAKEAEVLPAVAAVESTPTESPDALQEEGLDESLDENGDVIEADTDEASEEIVEVSSSSPIKPVAGIIGVAGGGIAFKVYKDKAAQDEEERQRQFQLLMGVENDTDNNDEEEESDILSSLGTKDKQESAPAPTPAPVAAPKKRRSGIASVFSKKSDRETDLSNLVSPGANAPEFATLLAKILTFGAPGRFPDVEALPGGEPMKSFDLEEAKTMLSENRSKLGLSDEASAEIFASVVNCMIIDIIDLASSSLGAKEKKNKTTVDALNIVMDFMDHAASLFDSVAGEVVINPVTYGGTLGKNKLEQMFTAYASSMMTSMDGSITQDRVDTLQQVFNIADKKADGLVQKGMMKNLMSMMKDGDGLEGMEGMEGLAEMMGAMGGEGGMEGLPGMGGGDLSPEEIKQSVAMMKELVDSGSVSKEELDLVRSQFKEAYGSDIQELIDAADKEGSEEDLGEDGKELLDLFKTILKDDK